MSLIAMIPARLGSQRLKQKNLQDLDGVPLITHAIRKCRDIDLFDEVWVNSEDDVFGEIAKDEGVSFYKRPAHLANDQATSEQYIADFFQFKECERLIQVHSIAPLLTAGEIEAFSAYFCENSCDTLLSIEHIQIECVLNGEPVNFTFDEKTNSQKLDPVSRISWSITGWKRSTYMDAFEAGHCATYSGEVDYFRLNSLASHVIKTKRDLEIAEALLPIVLS